VGNIPKDLKWRQKFRKISLKKIINNHNHKKYHILEKLFEKNIEKVWRPHAPWAEGAMTLKKGYPPGHDPWKKILFLERCPPGTEGGGKK